MFFLSFCHLSANGMSVAMRQKVLDRARELMNDTEPNALQLMHRLDSVALLDVCPDSLFVSFVVRDVGGYFRQKGRQPAAVEIFSMLAGTLEQENAEPPLLLRLYIPLGAAFEEVGMWNSAMEYYHRALSVAKQYGMQPYMAQVYNNIGAIYFRNDAAKAEMYFKKALDINKQIGDRKEMCLNYNNLAGAAVKEQRYDEALGYMLDALQLIDKKEDVYFYHFMQTNIAYIYILTGESYLAVSYLNNAVAYHEQENNVADLIQCYNMLVEAYTAQGNNKMAMHYATLSESLLSSVSNPDLESGVYSVLSNFYGNQGNYRKAYDLLVKASFLKDSLSNANDVRKISDLEQIYNNEQKLRENALVISEMQLHKLKSDRRIIAVVIVVILLGITVMFLIVRARLREKLHKTREELAMQQIALSEKEKELQRIKEKELNKTIDQKNRELSSYALTYMQDNEFMAHICDELKQVLLEINPRDKAHKEHLRKILSELKQHCAPDNWQEFRLYFEQVHPSFYDTLDEICPGITQRQKRLCALLYIGLSTKEIASVMFREVRSVESARNRLRKKMNIPPEESITDFLSRHLSDVGADAR